MVFLALALRARGVAGYGRGKLGPSWPSPFGRAAFVGTWLLRSCSKLGLAPTLLPSELCRVAAKLDQALIDDALVLDLQEGKPCAPTTDTELVEYKGSVSTWNELLAAVPRPMRRGDSRNYLDTHERRGTLRHVRKPRSAAEVSASDSAR